MKNSRLLRALCACALLAVGSCSVSPRYRRPDIALPDRWRDTADVHATAVWPDAAWWHGFGSETLDDLIAQAQSSNFDLAAAIARIREADAQARVAGAALLPSLNFGATAARQEARLAGIGVATFNTLSPELSASYEVDFWGKNRATLASARATALGSRYDEETVALTVLSSVATTYFQALEYRDRLAVARSNLANGELILHGFQLELNAGTATGLDVAQQDTTVALLRAAIPPLQLQLRQTVDALAVLVGKNPESMDVDTGSLASLTMPPIVAGLPSQLLSRRPDIAESEQQLISANANIGAARAALFPSFQLTASGGYASSALASLVSPAGRVWALTAGLTQPIFHGGALRAQVQFSEARYDELLSAYHKTIISALSNVEDALVAIQQTSEQQLRQQEAVERARRAFRFAQMQMSAGTANILSVLNTENALFSAEDVLVQVRYQQVQSLVSLFTALGGGWQQG